MTRWIVKVEPLPNGDAFIEFPDAVLALTGWKVNDALEVSVTPTRAIVLVRPKIAAKLG